MCLQVGFFETELINPLANRLMSAEIELFVLLLQDLGSIIWPLASTVYDAIFCLKDAEFTRVLPST